MIPLAADGVDATVFAAFGVGIVSFLSPCVLPLVPGYLAAISGLEFAEIEAGKSRLKVLLPAIIFCLSFSAMFIALGMTATGLGETLGENRETLREVPGILIALMGVFFIGTLFLPMLNREWRPEALMRRVATGGPVLAGFAFAVAWLPCTGPTLGAILTAAANEGTVGEGGFLLAFYSLGLAVPFLLSALAFTQVTSFFRFFRDHYAIITAVGGVILIVMGVLLYRNDLTELNSWLTDAGVNAISDL